MNSASHFQLCTNDLDYPQAVRTYLGEDTAERIEAIGNPGILRHKALALFCSVRCPGNLILQTYDLALRLRDRGIAVIGGFHSPMERECLTVLLRGAQPVIICPARSIARMRIPAEYKKPLESGRLLLLSPFPEKQDRPTTDMAVRRNRFVAALAERIFVAYAEPQSKTEQFCRDIVSWGKPLYTLDSDANSNLISLGAEPVTPDAVL